MWSGDIQSGYPTQWALNPSAYQNVPNEEVDWATLAQQWIQMKETFPADQVPPAPPPPSIKADVQAGEAPMDVAKDDVSPVLSASTSQDGSNWNNWNNWQQWNWGWNSTSDKTSPYNYSSNAQAYNSDTAPTTFDYNHGASVPKSHDQHGYWSGNQAPFMKHKSAEWRNESRSSSSRRHSVKVEEPESDTTSIIDAAKRKQLPAWIREGLEKMEREKQKKLERERMLKEREEEMLKKKEEEDAALASGIPIKSKFDTDSEGSEKGDEEIVEKPKKSRFSKSISPDLTNTFCPKVPSPPPPIKIKSREEIMQDIMQQMRYILTDILMEVTNEEMAKIAEEVLADARAKAPATQLRKTQALSSLTGKLGLGIYDSDSEESSGDSDSDQRSKRRNGVDSDEELRERIVRKKEEFSRIERDIEYEVEQREERERQREAGRELAATVEPQVEPCQATLGIRSDVKTEKKEDTKLPIVESVNNDNKIEVLTPQRHFKVEKESSEEATEESDHNSSSTSHSSSRSSSGSRYKKSRKSSKRKKEKKSSKRKRKRSSSRGSERKKSSRKKSSHSRHYERSRSRSHSRDDYHYRRSRSPSYHRRHSSESSYRRHHHSYTPSPEHYRGKKSSHRSRD